MTNLEDCLTGNAESGCYDNSVNTTQILTGMVINLIIGLACYAGFVLWRGSFRIYYNRLEAPQVRPEQRPPPLRLGSHWQLWSWLIPVFSVSDEQLLEQCGLDALVAQRVMGFGCMCMLPLTVLGVAVLLPINYTQYKPTETTTTTDGENTTALLTDEFLQLTMSAIPSGSKVLWVPFFFTYIFIGWVCWLLVHYYKEFVSLRQAHDQRLIESTNLEQRVSLLCDPEEAADRVGSGADKVGSSAAPQIVSMQRLMSMQQRRSDASEAAQLGGGGSLPGSAVGSDGMLAVPRRSSANPYLGDSTLALQPATSRAVPAPAASGSSQQRLSSGSAAGPQPELLHSGSAGGNRAGSQLIHRHSSHVAGSRDLPPAASGTGSPGLGTSSSELPLSPFESATPKAGYSGLQRITDEGTAEGQVTDDVEQQGGAAWPQRSGSGKGAAWEELAQPAPLVQLADAAQFYTVLIVDEAVERFKHRKEDSIWIRHLPTRVRETPRKGKDAFKSLFRKTKGLVKTDHDAHQEYVDRCNLRMQVAQDLYSDIFGEDFDRVVPVYNTNAADGLLMKWYRKRLLLDRQLLEREQLQGQQAQLREEVAAALEAADRRLAELAQAEEQGQQAAAAEAAEAAEVGGPERSQQEEEPELGLRAKYSETEGRAQPAAAGAAEAPDSPARCWQRAPPTVQQQEARAARIKGKLEKVAARIAESEAGLADLQRQIEEAQQEAAEAQPAPCFFACFRTAHAAAYAARLNLNPLQQRMMRVMPAPAPTNVNYTTMTRGWAARGFRPIPVFVAVIFMLILPIGLFAGICATFVSSICSNEGGTTVLYAGDSWFCSDNTWANLLRNLISSTLPAILLSVWQAVVLPIWFYTCAQAEAQHFSLSSLDLRCAHWFFLHDLFNVFLGGMLGGSIVWGLRAVIDDPSQFFTILGNAIPSSSNFFINYVSYRAIGMSFFRLFFPHAAVFGNILKWLHILPKPKTAMAKEAAAPPISCRYSRDIGVLQMSVLLVVLGYGVVTPVILPFGLLYFILWYPIWRYQMLYVFQQHYDAHGLFWIYVAHRVVVCLGVMAAFTSAVLAVKEAYVQGLVLLITSIVFLVWFDRYLTFRYDNVVDQVPAVGIHHAPRARVDDNLYVPPPMRPGAAGWAIDWGKAWVGYGAPRTGL